MGSAFLQALQKAFPDIPRYVYDTDTAKAESLDAQLCASPEETAAKSDITILAVKPQILPDIAAVLHGGKYISIAAGITLSALKKMLSTSDVVRFMPTIAAMVSSSPVAVTWDTSDEPSWSSDAMKIADSAGSALWIPERLFSGFIGVSGSGIAYIFQFLHAMALGGTKSGLPYSQSLTLAKETMKGALAMLDASGMNPAEAVSLVTSPGGTTIEGIYALESGGFTPAVMNAVSAAAKKSDSIT